MCSYLHFLACIIFTCLDVDSCDGPLCVSKDGVDGNDVFSAWAKALDHIEVKCITQIYVLYVSIWKKQDVNE